MAKNTPDRGLEHLLRCKAAEWAVASQLALRGHVPMFPSVDSGVDIYLNNGLRLQVKCASLRENNRGVSGIQRTFGYFFELRRGAWFQNEKKYRKTSLRPYSEVADYFVLWGIEENRFFIVPTKPERARIWFSCKGVVSRSNNKRLLDQVTEDRLREFEDRWDLLDINGVASIVESATLTKTAESPSEIEFKEKS